MAPRFEIHFSSVWHETVQKMSVVIEYLIKQVVVSVICNFSYGFLTQKYDLQ